MAQAYTLILHLKPLYQLLCDRRINPARTERGLQYHWLVQERHSQIALSRVAHVQKRRLGLFHLRFACCESVQVLEHWRRAEVQNASCNSHLFRPLPHCTHTMDKFKLVKQQKACVKYVYTHTEGGLCKLCLTNNMLLLQKK